MQDKTPDALRAAMAALESQRATLGDEVLELALAPLRARLAALSRPAGLQHRHVAVLFVDVVGSTALAQSLDAEDTLDLLGGTLRRMAEIVEAHQGRVLRFTGDGVKAVFGMDQAREDDAERAVRAGLAMVALGGERAAVAQRRYGIADFAVRVGVHCGEVALGAGLEADNTAMGAAVHIAARMEQSAPPGTLRISQDTWAMVRGLFEVEPQPPLHVKGVEAPMQTYLVRAALNRHAARQERGLRGVATPLIGRAAELGRLRDTVAQARSSGRLHTVTLVADAGLGKSRLLRELAAGLGGLRQLMLRSQPDGMLRPWGLLRSLLATQCGVADDDSGDVARHKVVQALAPWFARYDGRDDRQNIGEGERQAQLLGQLAGLDFGDSPHLRGLDSRSLRDQAFVASRSYLRALAARDGAPPLLLVEDLQWADDSSLDWLQHLMDHADALPLALVMTCRPALRARRPDWGLPEHVVVLGPLAPSDGQALAHALLQHLPQPPAQITDLLIRRAEGNPYYMEELLRRVIDDGVIDTGGPHWTMHVERLDQIRQPGTLVGLLQARLDALPAAERAAARKASVIGAVFWDDALRTLDAQAPRALPALEHVGFVRSHDRSAFEGTTERQFDHHLLHQVTYDTVLKADRRAAHARAARWLLDRSPGREGELAGPIAEHFERAGERSQAVDHWLRAAWRWTRAVTCTAACACMACGPRSTAVAATPQCTRTRRRRWRGWPSASTTTRSGCRWPSNACGGCSCRRASPRSWTWPASGWPARRSGRRATLAACTG